MEKIKHYTRALFLTVLILSALIGSIHLLMNAAGIPQHNEAIKNHFEQGNQIMCKYTKNSKEEILSKDNASFDRGVYFLSNNRKLKRITYNPGNCKVIKKDK